MKDHYQLLEIGPKASPEEIKKSFRRLAHEFHPDKNPDNVFAEARFREIQEAYQVLSDPGKRKLYDHERWLSGRFAKHAHVIDPAYLLEESRKLNAHIAQIDVYRMNRELLHRYLMFLLSDEKIALVRKRHDPAILNGLIREILRSSAALPPYFAGSVIARLLLLAGENDPDATALLKRRERQLRRQQMMDAAYPWIILAVTALVCMAMYLFSRR